MSLLGISRELQRRVCNHGKPPGSSRTPRARELFHRKEVNFERTLVSKESMTFTGCILCRKGEESFFFLLGFAIATSMRVAPFLSSQLCLIEFLETEYNFDPEESIPSSPIFLSIPFCLPQLDYYVLLSHLDYKCVHIHIPSRVIL